MMRAAERRARERATDAQPASWGIAPGFFELPANDDVDVRIQGGRGAVVRPRRRSDAFQILHASGSLSGSEYGASQRYWADWCARCGVIERETLRLEVIQASGAADGATQGMIDAGKRVAQAHRHVGRATAQLLQALVEPLVARGEIRVWRELVRHATGASERHAQAALVVQACRDLVYAYDDIDRDSGRRRKAPAAAAGGV